MTEVDTRHRAGAGNRVHPGQVIARPFILLALLALFGSQASARMILKATPASVASGWPFSTSYQASLLDVAAGVEVGDLFAVAGGVKAYEWSGWWYGQGYSTFLPVYGYVLLNSEEQDYSNRVVPYVLLGVQPFSIRRYNALVGSAGLGVAWNFYVVSAGAEFKATAWHTPYTNDVLYTLQLNVGLGGWYALGDREGSGLLYNP